MKLLKEIETNKKINSPKILKKYLREFEEEDREFVIVIGLNTANNPIYREIVAIGTLNATIIAPREIFKKAITMSCNAIIMAHNHPSGNNKPSTQDKEVTKKIKEAGEIIDIKLIDHIIVTKEEYYSFREQDLL